MTVQSRAAYWSTHPVTRLYVREIRAMVARQTVVLSESQVLERLTDIADASMHQVIDSDGFLIPPTEWPPGFARAVASVEFDSAGRVHKLKMWSKPQALDLLARHHGLLAKDNIQRIPSPLDGLSRDQVQALKEAASEALKRKRAAITVDAQVIDSTGENGQ